MLLWLIMACASILPECLRKYQSKMDDNPINPEDGNNMQIYNQNLANDAPTLNAPQINPPQNNGPISRF